MASIEKNDIERLTTSIENLIEAIGRSKKSDSNFSKNSQTTKERSEFEKRITDIEKQKYLDKYRNQIGSGLTEEKKKDWKKAKDNIEMMKMYNNFSSSPSRAMGMMDTGAAMSAFGSRFAGKGGMKGVMGKAMSGMGSVLGKLGGKLLGPIGLVADALGAIGNVAASVMKSVGQLQKLDTEQTFENIQYGFDTMMKNMETSAKIALEGVGITNKSLVAATEAHYSVVGGDLTDSAYSAANNMVDLMAESMNFEQNRKLAEAEKQSYHLVRGQENVNRNKIIDAQRTQAYTNIGTGVVNSIAGAIPVIDDAVKGIANAVNATAELNVTMTENEAKLSEQQVKNEAQLYTTKVKFATDLRKLEIQRLSELKKQQLKYSQGIEKAFLKFDEQATRMSKNLGITDVKQMDVFKHTMLETQILTSKWGKTIEEINQIQSTYAEESGRNIQLSNVDFDKTFALSDLLGDDALATTLNASMNVFNQSVSSSNDMFFEMYQRANKMGISTQKYSKELVKNLKLAEKYQFRGGVKNLMEMAAWAQRTRFNMDSLNSMLDKVHEGGLEGLITQSAQLQVLGGPAAMGADPLAMAWESYNDPEAYGKRMQNMTRGIGRFNSKTGQTVFNQADQIRIEAMAKAQGRSKEDLFDEIRERNKRNDINKKLNPRIGTQEQKDFIGSRAQWENGEWKVTLNNGDKKSVNELSVDDIKNIMPIETEKKIEEYVLDIRNEVVKNKAVTQEAQSRISEKSYDSNAIEQQERREVAAEHYKENENSLLEQATQGMKDVTNSYKNSLELFNQNSDVISQSMNEASNAMNNLTQTLMKIHNISNDEINNFNSEPEKYGYSSSMQLVNPQAIDALNKFAQWRGSEEMDNKMNEIVQILDNTEYSDVKKQKALAEVLTQGYDDFYDAMDNVSMRHNDNVDLNTIIDEAKTLATAYYSDQFKPVLDEIKTKEVNREKQRAEATANVVINKDGIMSSNNNEPMLTRASNVMPIHDGSVKIAKSDPKDKALFAKDGGPFDILFNNIFDKINQVYGIMSNKNVEVKALPYTNLPYNGSDNLKDGIMSSNNNEPMLTRASNGQSGQTSLKIEPLKIEMSGRLELASTNGQSVDIIKELENNPMLMRAISQMLTDQISKAINGGKAVYNGNRPF